MNPSSNVDTIAAISTAAGEGAIGIVRVSGPDALLICRRIFPAIGRIKVVEPRRLYYGDFFAISSEVRAGDEPQAHTRVGLIDNGYAVYMPAPASYTGEDVAEFYSHGGMLVVRKLLDACLAAGARQAEPGEFTRRAFLNGKIDLTQAEAVIDVIRAQTETALASARARLAGAFSKKVNSVKSMLVTLLAHVEAELDFPEDRVPEAPEPLKTLADAAGYIERMIATYDEGATLRDGIKTIILGRPNVGKSSLLNVLLQEERAIVTPQPGTTRDLIEEVVNVRGIPVRLMDTAGLRESLDPVEAIGVRLAMERVEHARLVLFVVDASEDFTKDLELLKIAEGKSVIVVVNKIDSVGEAFKNNVASLFEGRRAVCISALGEIGIDELKDAIYEAAAGHPYASAGATPPGELIVSVRHRDALLKALESLHGAQKAIEGNLPREMLASDVRYAIDRLGDITGETTAEDVLDVIFSSFCIGK